MGLIAAAMRGSMGGACASDSSAGEAGADLREGGGAGCTGGSAAEQAASAAAMITTARLIGSPAHERFDLVGRFGYRRCQDLGNAIGDQHVVFDPDAANVG